MEKWSLDNTYIQFYGCICLSVLTAGNEDGAKAVAETNGITEMVLVLVTSLKADCKGAAMHSLRLLIRNHPDFSRIIPLVLSLPGVEGDFSDGIHAVTQVMKESPNNALLQKTAIALLMTLAKDKAAKEKMKSAGVFTLIGRALDLHHNNKNFDSAYSVECFEILARNG